MYNEVKAICEIFASKGQAKFTYVFKHVDCSKNVQEKIKAYLMNNNFIEDVHSEGNWFGMEADYELNSTGKNFYRQLMDYESFDKILSQIFDRQNTSFLSIKQICDLLSIEYSKAFDIRLEDDGMITPIPSKDYTAYKITNKGKKWIAVTGGYRRWIALHIESYYFDNVPKADTKSNFKSTDDDSKKDDGYVW